ncbi:hypothetical protein FEM48_Zijuj09G0062400 [Ziziphus jujuba var. spinosa]|uniref:Leucine-rich repeat-containing N-terminal plant-type domain-containing protein n=1 Tax=Ziziphus jujuba var. spinosa TaxID=714518 RepID=A0A978URC7_ZIZJJ|nr:hypothetical protein FEM48_Zijuj09G0062400 [Ziziphus jujuba var. spinosa]
MSLNSSSLTSWTLTNSSSSPCQWTGIECDEVGSIVEITLANSGVDGTLDSNNFTQSIHVEIGNLLELQFLCLYNNSLTELWLNYNCLKEVPPFISECPKLTFVDLSDNLITGQIPVQPLTSLQNLEYLNLTKNSFEGSIPAEGPIPSSVGNLQKLEKLVLKNAGINSTIPEELGFCTNLNFLDLSQNSLRELISLQLQINELSGFIPKEIGSLQKLNYLYLFDNQFSGPLPLEIGNLSNLLDLQLFNNLFTRPVPSTIANLSKLTKLGLQLNRNPPQEIGYLESLEEFDISANKLEGILTTSITNLEKVTVFYVSFNNFSGSIPKDFGPNFLRNISDFGIARLLRDGKSNWTAPVGSYGYMAPGDMLVKDVLDKRLGPPAAPIKQDLVLAVNLSLACINQNPSSRPTMYEVSTQLSDSAATYPSLYESSQMLTLQNLMNYV